MNSVKEVLDSINIYIDKYINNINFGGCGKLTYLVSNELDKLNIPYKICLSSPLFKSKINKYYCEELNYNYIDICKEFYIIPEHIWLLVFDTKIQEYIFFNGDSDNYQIIDNIDEISSLRQNIKCSYLAKYTWNPQYDITQNNKLRKAIQYRFKKLKDEI